MIAKAAAVAVAQSSAHTEHLGDLLSLVSWLTFAPSMSAFVRSVVTESSVSPGSKV